MESFMPRVVTTDMATNGLLLTLVERELARMDSSPDNTPVRTRYYLDYYEVWLALKSDRANHIESENENATSGEKDHN